MTYSLADNDMPFFFKKLIIVFLLDITKIVKVITFIDGNNINLFYQSANRYTNIIY